MEEHDIEPGQIWVNNRIPYIVNGRVLDATDYEKTKKLREKIFYTQARDAKLPAGTSYVRDREDFLSNFTLKDE